MKAIKIAHIRPQSREDNWGDRWMREITCSKFAGHNLNIDYYYGNSYENDNILQHNILDLGEFSFEPAFKELANKGVENSIPVVSTCIEVLLSSLEENCKRNNLKKADLAGVSHFIAVTTWTRDLLYHFGIDPAKISVIPCACDLTMQPVHHGTSEPPTLLYLGSLNRKKGFDIVLNEFRKLKGGLLRIVIGEFNNEQEYLRRLKSIRNAEIYRFPGIGNLNEIYNYVDVVVYLGCFSEPLQFGHPLLWGLSFGKALISLNQGGPRDMIENGRNGFLCNSYSEINEAMQYFIDNENEIKRFGDHSRMKAEKQFSADIVAKKYNDVFRRALNEN